MDSLTPGRDGSAGRRRPAAAPSRPRRRLVRWSIAALVMLALTAAWWWAVRKPPVSPAPVRLWPVVVTTIAGAGAPGRADGLGSAAMFSDPFGVAIDQQGTIYVSDAGEANCIRRIRAGSVDTIAGGSEGRRDGRGVEASFNTPSGLALAPDGSLVVADTQNHAVRRITSDGEVTTIAGDGVPGRVDGRAEQARFDAPVGVAVDRDGRIYVADTYNDAIRVISPDGRVSTLAGGDGTGFEDGEAAAATFDTPAGVAVDASGTVWIADTGNNAIRRVHPTEGVSTLVLRPEGPEVVAIPLERPLGVAIGPRNLLYVTDGLNRVLVVSPDGRSRVLAGGGAGYATGEGHTARFNGLAGLAVSSGGTIVVADADNYLLRALTPPGVARPPGDRFLMSLPRLTPETLGLAVLPWPIAPQDAWHEVTATLGEARGSLGGDGRERLHAGVDIHADVGVPVLSVVSEKVTRVLPVAGEGDLNEMLRVGLVNYVHVRAGRDPQGFSLDPARFQLQFDALGRVARVRVRRGTRFAVGDQVGTANPYAHVHLGIGPHGAEVNPLRFSLPQFTDAVPPTILLHGIRLLDEHGLPFPTEKQLPIVSGRAAIVVEAYDSADGVQRRRRLGIYRLGYQVLHEDGRLVPGFETPLTTMVFDRLPSVPGAGRLVYDEGSGITVYGNRRTRFRYIVTNRVMGGEAEPDWWDSSTLDPGWYRIRVTAADSAGNESSRDAVVRVR